MIYAHTAYAYLKLLDPGHPPYLRDTTPGGYRNLAAHNPLAACCTRNALFLFGWLCAAEGAAGLPAGRRRSTGPPGPRARLQAAHLHSQAVGPNGFKRKGGSRLAQLELVEAVDEPVVLVSADLVHLMHICLSGAVVCTVAFGLETHNQLH